MGEQSAPRLGGDDYQHLYSWYEILRLLDEGSPYAHAFVEHPEAGAADDVTFHPQEGSAAATRLVQVKWHVDYKSQYTFETLLTVTSGTRSLLRKLFDSWKDQRADGSVEIWLVSNWSPAPGPDLGAYLADRGGMLKDEFFTLGSRSRAGQARKSWAEALGASDEELAAFCRDLRFELGYSTIERLYDRFDDRMGRYGLRMGENARAIALDEISRRIQQGGDAKRITREDLLTIADRRGLWADTPDAPEVRLWVHGWARQGYEGEPTVELDLTDLFDREERRIASPRDWTDRLWPQLREVRERLAATPEGRYVDVRGRLPLTVALAIGAALPEVAGFNLRVEQVTNGQNHLWKSSAAPSDASFVVQNEAGAPGPDVLLGLGITGPCAGDVRRLAEHIGASAWVYAEPGAGTGITGLRDASDAAALARSGKALVREVCERYGAARVHFVLFGPAAFALFLGQLLNAVGTIVTYERNLDGDYQESVTLRTG
jgi:hypothetical protein